MCVCVRWGKKRDGRTDGQGVSRSRMVRLSEQGVKVLELNLPIYPLAEESDLLSLSALLWTFKVWNFLINLW